KNSAAYKAKEKEVIKQKQIVKNANTNLNKQVTKLTNLEKAHSKAENNMHTALMYSTIFLDMSNSNQRSTFDTVKKCLTSYFKINEQGSEFLRSKFPNWQF
ncbi:hypothetical protein tpqmel_1038, partial [Candidatus Gastranaerophilus sp. (ex Termes propinquus)]